MNEHEALFQQIIADHAEHPRRRGFADPDSGFELFESYQLNPSCGDEVRLRLGFGADGGAEIVWLGRGCVVSQASASMLAETLSGLNLYQLRMRMAAFREMIFSRGEFSGDEQLLGDAIALSGAGRFVARVKCVMLAWVALEDALVVSAKR